MTVNILSSRRVLVILYESDLENLGGLEESVSEESIKKITRLACEKSGIDGRGRQISIEALAFEREWYLLLTFKNRQRPSYRLKSPADSRCYKFADSESFLSAVELMYRENVYCPRNSAYLYNGGYYIIFDYISLPAPLRRVLSEYSEKRGGRLAAAKVRENGLPLCPRNAVQQIGRHLV